MLRSINADEKSWRSRCFEFRFHQLFAEDAKQCLELHDNGVRLVSSLLRRRLLSGNLVFAKARHRGRVLLSAPITGGAFTSRERCCCTSLHARFSQRGDASGLCSPGSQITLVQEVQQFPFRTNAFIMRRHKDAALQLIIQITQT